LPLEAALLHLDTDLELHRLSHGSGDAAVSPDDETSGRRPKRAPVQRRHRLVLAEAKQAALRSAHREAVVAALEMSVAMRNTW
jgi:hypothetical protein